MKNKEELIKIMKSKKFIIGGASALAVVGIGFGIAYANADDLVLKSEEITSEYGEVLSSDVKSYLNTDKSNKDAMEKAVLDLSGVSQVANEGYPSLGKHTIKVTFGDESHEVLVNVVDTTKPKFKDFKEEVEFVRDCKPSAEEFSKMFTADDSDTTTITVDDSKVDYSKEGEYTATVKAIDGSKNEVTQDIKVKITAPTIKLDKSKDIVYEGESLVLKADIKGKDTKAVFKSSDEKVATVDSNGKVKAKDSGKATITATANGVEAKFNLTVKAKPKNSSTEKKTVINPNTGKKEEVTVIKPSKPSSSGGSGSSSSSSGGSSSQNLKASISMEAFNIINEERAKRGLPKYSYCSRYESLALERAKEISQNFSHKGFYNRNLINTGEIIAEMNTSNTARAAVNAWMNSEVHRSSILSESANQMVVAHYGNYWVAIDYIAE